MMELFVRELGAGSPLVILHGLYGMSDNWLTPGRQLAERYHVLLPDQRNHGRSPHHPRHDYPALAADVEEMLDRRKLHQTVLLGHSMGGKAAMWFALQHPQQVKALIVADIAPRTYSREESRSYARHEAILAAMSKIELSHYRSRNEVAAALAGAIPEERIRLFLLKNLARNKEGRFFWRLNVEVLRRNLPAIMAGPADDPTLAGARYEGPVLFLRGGRSPYVSDEDIPLIRRFFPKAQLVTLEDAGHWLHAERPEAFLEKITDFLQEAEHSI